MTAKVQNATITRTMLGYEHGVLTFMISLDYGSAGQGFGGYRLDEFIKKTKTHQGTAGGLDLIMCILKVLEVQSWEQLVGISVRARADHGQVYAIGHFLRDQWVDVEKHFERWKLKELDRNMNTILEEEAQS